MRQLKLFRWAAILSLALALAPPAARPRRRFVALRRRRLPLVSRPLAASAPESDFPKSLAAYLCPHRPVPSRSRHRSRYF